MKKIVFLFSTIKANDKYFLTFSGQKISGWVAWLYPRRVEWSSVSWESELAEELASNVYPSALMRSVMTAQIIASHAPAGYEVLCTNVPHVRNSIVIVEKELVNRRKLLLYLRMLGNTVLVDLVDGRLKPDRLWLVDGIICCSRRGEKAYRSSQQKVPVYFVQHCLDPRLPAVIPPADRLHTWYFGAPQNLYLPESVAGQVRTSITERTDKSPATQWLSDLPQANFHYAVRGKMKSYTHKPFLKGFIAAHCSSNIMIHEGDGDAAFYLGEGYPYLLRGELTPEAIRACHDKAEREFGGPVWNQGLAVMDKIRSSCTAEVVASQFWEMVRAVSQ